MGILIFGDMVGDGMRFKSIKEILSRSSGNHTVLRDNIMSTKEIRQANGAYWAISQIETVSGFDKSVFEKEFEFLAAIGYENIDSESTFSKAENDACRVNNPLYSCWRTIKSYQEDYGIQLNLRRLVNFREVAERDYWVQNSIFPVPELFGCDGTTDFWHHTRTQKVMADIGVDCAEAYKDGYNEEYWAAGSVFDEKQHLFFTDDPIERANNVLWDLYQINNRSFVDALVEKHPALVFSDFNKKERIGQLLNRSERHEAPRLSSPAFRP